MHSTGHPRRFGHILIVEPETLLLWSLTTYLERWYTVHSACMEAAALRILEQHRIAAVVVSDELPQGAADRIAVRVHAANPSAVAVRTVSQRVPENGGSPDSSGALLLEKPFRLSKLAGLLGVTATVPDASSEVD